MSATSTTPAAVLMLLWASVAGNAFAQSLDTRYEYDALGRPTAIIDAAGHTERKVWDVHGRLQREANPLDERTTYHYGHTAHPASVLAPNGALTTFDVDGLGQIHSETSPDRGTTTYVHDAAGNLTSRIDARGARMDVAYDALNRPLERRFLRPDGSLEATHTYRWDNAPNGRGRLGTLATDTHTLEFAYTPTGALATRTATRSGVRLSTQWEHDPGSGRLLSLTYPSGSTLTYDYDASGRVQNLYWDGAPIAGNIDYFPFGPPTALSLANGIDHLRHYDSAGRPKAYTLAGYTVQIIHDASGRIIELDPGIPTYAQRFGYDAAGRLTDYQGFIHTETYAYDASGNRLERSHNGVLNRYAYEANSNRLIGIDELALSHDLAGHLIADTRRFTHDSRGRLSELIMGGQHTRYDYNGLGERSYKAHSGQARHYIYDEAGRLLGEYDGQGRVLTEYAWLDALPVAMRRPGGPSGAELYAIETDHLGTPRLITDANRRIRWHWHSAPFGDTAPNENPGGVGALTFNLRFPGQYYDAESGLHYNYFRDYDPDAGRYIQSDPIGLAGGLIYMPMSWEIRFLSLIRWVCTKEISGTASIIVNSSVGFIGVGSKRVTPMQTRKKSPRPTPSG